MRVAKRQTLKLLLLLLNLAAFGILGAAWVHSRASDGRAVVLAVPAPPPAPPAPPVPLVAGEAWAAQDEIAGIKDRLDVTESEIGEIIDAVMSVRRNTSLLAEQVQGLEERLGAVERTLQLELAPLSAPEVEPLDVPTQ